MLQELLRVARVLTGNLVDLFQDAQGAQRDVFQISNRRGHQVQACFMSAGLLLHAGKSSTRVGVCRACYTAVFKTQAEETALPLYEYQCLKCGKKTEKIESGSGPPLKKCPNSAAKAQRLHSPPPIHFKPSRCDLPATPAKPT